MKQLRFYPFIRDYFLKHPVLFYAFILPVYLPVRSLGEDFPVYHFLINSDYERIFYFLYVLFQSAIAGVVLSLILRILLKRKIVAESHLLSHMRVMGLLFVLLFTLTTYWILMPVSVTGLYLASGAHYVCSAFLANLVILEAKHYRLPLSAKNNDIAKAIGSGVFGLNVDILGILAYGVMSLFVDYVGVQYYIRFCVGLEVAFFFYLFIVRRYWNDVLLLIATQARFITVFMAHLRLCRYRKAIK